MGMGRCEVERGEYLTFNSRVQPVARESDELLWTDISKRPRFVIGNEVSEGDIGTTGSCYGEREEGSM